MKRRSAASSRSRDRSLAALGLVAALAVAGCGSGDSDGQPTPLDGNSLAQTASIIDGTGSYPIWSFSFPLTAKGSLMVSSAGQNYEHDVVTDLKGCTIGNLGAVDDSIKAENVNDGAKYAERVAALATVIGNFATTADRSAGDNFAFWRLGDAGTENWSSYFYGPDERWSGSGSDAVVEAKFFEMYADHATLGRVGFPVLGIRVRWAGEATENESLRKSSATVEFECYFAPTGDLIIASNAWIDANENEVLDDNEAAYLRLQATALDRTW